MEIVGIKGLLKLKIKPHMEMFEASLTIPNIIKIINNDEDVNYIAEEEKCINEILNKFPEIKAMYDIERVYGPFHIKTDLKLNDYYEDILCDILFNTELFCIYSERLKFYDKETHRYCDCVYGSNISDICKKYINKCMNNLIRFMNEEGEGYATTNVREIIMNSGVRIGCIN